MTGIGEVSQRNRTTKAKQRKNGHGEGGVWGLKGISKKINPT